VFFFFKQKPASEIYSGLVGWELCKKDSFLSRTNPPGADLNVAKQRPEGWGAEKPAINGQASNQSEARPHGRAFCVFIHEKLKHPE
ncbi:hypothetical protein, partial [Raoultella ornithinolytica]|uniref:hypothetical protein n=1 Tax=Raoultella ornithinolytica TaxID=54291 RepID=UPI00384E607C